MQTPFQERPHPVTRRFAFITLASLALLASPVSAQENRSRLVFNPGTNTPAEETAQPKSPPASISPTPGSLDPEISKRIGGFFDHLKKKETKEAYDLLTKESTIADKAEDLTTLKEKTEQAYGLFGAVEGYEIIGIKRIGTRLLGINALSLGERFPLRWMFSFYRGKSGWKLIDIQVDDRVAALFGDRKDEPEGAETPWPR
jgi:hypothetical protein